MLVLASRPCPCFRRAKSQTASGVGLPGGGAASTELRFVSGAAGNYHTMGLKLDGSIPT